MKLVRMRRLLDSCSTNCRSIGVLQLCERTCTTARQDWKLLTPGSVAVQSRYFEYPAKFRTCSSVPLIFDQIIMDNEYLPIGNQQITPILDSRANAGFTGKRILGRFPNAHVFASQSDAANRLALSKNWDTRTKTKLLRKEIA